MPQWLFGTGSVLCCSVTRKPKYLTLRISSRRSLVPDEYSPVFINAVAGLLLCFSEGKGGGNRGMGKQLQSPNC